MGWKINGRKLIKNKMGKGIWKQKTVAYDHLQMISRDTVDTFSSFHVINSKKNTFFRYVCIDYHVYFILRIKR